MPKNFAITGIAGYIAPRHLRAIRDTGNRLVAAVDPHDSVGLLDQFGFDVRYFSEIERFDRHLEKLRRAGDAERVHYLSVCSPNYLHDAHCRLGLRTGADVICEKPLVINPWNVDLLRELEHETGHRVFNVLQLRVHPALMKLREELLQQRGTRKEVVLTYITGRGAWYHVSWKGQEEKSGGVATNIGVHFFDMLLWLFGDSGECQVHLSEKGRMAGYIELEHARVRWFLSIDTADLPPSAREAGKTTFRSITVDGAEIEFTEGFTELHTRIYEEILAGRGFGIDDAYPAIDLVHKIRTVPITRGGALAHPMLTSAPVAGA